MKLLQWVHRKLWQNNIDPFMNSTFGNSCICISMQSATDDQDSHGGPSFSPSDRSRSFKQLQEESQKSFSDTEEKKGNSLEEKSNEISELFHGFLTIGTLGIEAISDEPATPTFVMPLENMTGSAELTEEDLKLINHELEKFLEAESKEEGYYESSGRNSQVSTITLSGQQMEEVEDENYENTTVCPLQGYLFGSSIELPEAKIEVKKEKTSLAELFRRTKIMDENSTEKRETGDLQVKETQKASMHIMRKILKKVLAGPRNSAHSAGGDEAKSVSTSKKLHKVLRMFHQKIHPDRSRNAKECSKFHKHKIKDAHKGDVMHLDESNHIFSCQSMPHKSKQSHKTNLTAPPNGLSGSHASGQREQWIKTDSEYLVLEL